MIKVEHIVLPSAAQMQFVIEGMRNPLNSWEKSDSHVCHELGCDECSGHGTCQQHEYPGWFKTFWDGGPWEGGDELVPGPNDHDLMRRLAKAGPEHRKYLRQMPVMMRITAPLYWWKEFDTYKVGTVANSCSTMHKITEKPFEKSDFSCEDLLSILPGQPMDDIPVILLEPDHWLTPMGILESTVRMLNCLRDIYLVTHDEKIWRNIIQLLPSTYNQTRNVSMSYENVLNIRHQRDHHKLSEWNELCDLLDTLPYADLFTEVK